MPTDSETAMQTIEGLEQRWPGFRDYIRASNGYDVPSFTYEDFLRVHTQMLMDGEGVELLTSSLAVLVASHTVEPAVATWLRAHGFISYEMTRVHDELEQIQAQLPHATGAEREALGRRIREIQARSQELAQRNHAVMGGLDGEM